MSVLLLPPPPPTSALRSARLSIIACCAKHGSIRPTSGQGQLPGGTRKECSQFAQGCGAGSGSLSSST
eukprot:1651802-Alexandrium_andersonii.AAC.1